MAPCHDLFRLKRVFGFWLLGDFQRIRYTYPGQHLAHPSTFVRLSADFWATQFFDCGLAFPLEFFIGKLQKFDLLSSWPTMPQCFSISAFWICRNSFISLTICFWLSRFSSILRIWMMATRTLSMSCFRTSLSTELFSGSKQRKCLPFYTYRY